MKSIYNLGIMIVLLITMTASVSMAARGDILAEFNMKVNRFALDAKNNLVYATASNTNSVAVFNASTLQQIGDSVFIGSAPVGLSLSSDGRKLFVALSGANKIAVMDTTTRSISEIQTPEIPYDIETGSENRLYVTPNSGSPEKIMQIDSISGENTGNFSLDVTIYKKGFLEISNDRNILYFANTGLSPSTLAKFDVTSETPALLYKNAHGSLGSNGQDLALSHDNSAIYYPCGSGNGIGYVIYKISTTDMSVMGSFDCGAYPEEIELSPDDKTAFVVHESGSIDIFDTTTFLYQGQILTKSTTDKEANELISDISGKHLFAAFDDKLIVYDTGIEVNMNDYPAADAGPDQIVYNEVTLDGGNSTDSDGEIVSYHWELRHRENSEYDKTADGETITISGLEKGFYDVILTVTDNNGLQGNDEMLLSSTGHIRGDINFDNRIGLEDAIYVLKVLAGHNQ